MKSRDDSPSTGALFGAWMLGWVIVTLLMVLA